MGASTFQRFFWVFIAFAAIAFSGYAQKAEQSYKMKTVVIDAGHGGNDPGNLGTGRYKSKEKDISLDVAKRLGTLIKQTYPNVSVKYTRETDVFIGLNERADVANKADADIFISIHCNAAKSTTAQGVETFALGLHRNDENLQVAMKENQAIFLEDDYQTKYEGFDPNSPESIIALTIMQSAFLEQSLRISSYIQGQFKDSVGRKDRGVKQAGFLVLRRTTMPSILIELGFLTNAQEEDFLNTENGKATMASAIFRGFQEYKERVEGGTSTVKTPEIKPQPEAVKEKPVEVEKPKETPVPSTAEQEKAKKQQALDAAIAEKARLEKLKQEQAIEAQRKSREEQKRKEAADKLADEKRAKEGELEAAKVLAEQKEKQEKEDRLKREMVAEQARVEFAERLAEREKVKQDSIQQVHAMQREKVNNAPEKKESTVETAPVKKDVVPQLSDKPITADEAELLFLEKRRLELESRIAKVKGVEATPAVSAENTDLKSVEKPVAPVKAETSSKQSMPAAVAKGVVLSVQVASSAKPLDVNSPQFKGQKATSYVQDGMYKYIIGSFTTFAAASAEQSRLRKLGFEGAFVVAFRDGLRITADEARRVLK